MTTALLLKTCNDIRLSKEEGIVWPDSGLVEALEWDPDPRNKKGIQGLLWGEGNEKYLRCNPGSTSIVLEVDSDDIVALAHESFYPCVVKVPRGTIVYTGDYQPAARYILEHGGEGKYIIGISVIVGDDETAVAGDLGTAIAGDRGTAIVKSGGIATAGNYGTASTNFGIATAGDWGTATSYAGVAVAGNHGTAITELGKAIAGDDGTATATYAGRAKAGARGTAIAGPKGAAAAGVGGRISIEEYDIYSSHEDYQNSEEPSLVVGNIGEDGLLPNTLYCVRGGSFVPEEQLIRASQKAHDVREGQEQWRKQNA